MSLFPFSTAEAQTPAIVAQLQMDAEVRAQWATECEDWDDWDKPAPPFRIHGNTYYVGTCGIAAILISGKNHHALIDTGTRAGAEHVLENVRSLGFDPTDIVFLLNSHEHYDHIGGFAYVAEETGAAVYSSELARSVLETGYLDARDPQHGMHEPMDPVDFEAIIRNGEEIRVSRTLITAIDTPGHSPGALSWTWESCDQAAECRTMVYADSLSAVSSDEYRFSAHPEYLADFRAGIARLADLDCDILITPHPSASGMREKLLAGDLTSGMDCEAYAADRLERLEARLAREAAEAAQ